MAEENRELQEIYLQNIKLEKDLQDVKKALLQQQNERQTYTPPNRLIQMSTTEAMAEENMKLQEIYLETIKLREDMREVKGQLDEPKNEPEFDNLMKHKSQRTKGRCLDVKTAVLSIILLVLCFFLVGYMFYSSALNRDMIKSIKSETQAVSSPLFNALADRTDMAKAVASGYLNIGMRQDYKLQDCHKSEFKQSFPDIDYSMLGYNVLRGYPLSVGHDPGFTYPIFSADYSDGQQTADCRFSVPKGLTVIPDISCETSFFSTVSQTKYAFSNSLSVSANVGGGGWGVQFSASAGYKQASSEIGSGEYVYIISSATCSYYFSKLIKSFTPVFHPVFVDWIHRLNKTNDRVTYIAFFDIYGTHFPTDITFGAKFTYEYKMKSTTYEKKKENKVDVAVQASYSGLFSVSGGFGMSAENRESASEFSKSVEKKTITTGAAPPSNGDALTWASTVKDNPVPIQYKLESIEELFTEEYMADINVDKKRIFENIKQYKYAYCQYLKDSGSLSSCASLSPGVHLPGTRLAEHYDTTAASLTECIDYCLKQIHCFAITYCSDCPSTSANYNVCYMYNSNKEDVSVSDDFDRWTSYVFTEKITDFLEFSYTAVKGIPRTIESPSDRRADKHRCQQLCLEDANCLAYTHCDCSDKTETCELFSASNIQSLKYDSSSSTSFVSPRVRRVEETTSKTTTTTTTTTTSKPTNLPK